MTLINNIIQSQVHNSTAHHLYTFPPHSKHHTVSVLEFSLFLNPSTFPHLTSPTTLNKLEKNEILLYLYSHQIKNFSFEKDMVKSRERARKSLPIKLRHKSGGKKGYFSHLSMCVEAKAFKIKFMN